MARNKKLSGGTTRYNLPSETLERARAEMRGESTISEITPNLPADKIAKAQADVNKIGALKPKKLAFAKSARVPTVEEVRNTYGYVGRELRTLVILATALLIVIVVVALVLPRPSV